ncbi:DUF1398 family protein [Rhizobium sp. Root1220]|uniref:DUF1398 domain-containing protein n=1 Tax=Rhizobium sp. Root1220 TaxID=1736432 RepID=UPI00070072A1|nr:DUF1398 family protein [Rhizobium sp. Root1220]KQV65351.1 hypothetical protein ASC90_14515 [Rhizobium sp. Root1220]
MHNHVKSIVEECSKGSEENRLNFPQVIAKLAEAGVEGYFADLRRSNKIYYLPDGTSIEMASAPVEFPVAATFDATGVETAVRQAQRSEITYRIFCESVMAAGCAGYLVSLPGRRVVYFGRTAELHVEHFPSAN